MKKMILLSLLLMLTWASAFAQQRSRVTGTVTDTSGEAVIGASVIEKGTTNGIATGLDGSFALDVSSANAIIEISYFGFQTRELTVAQLAGGAPVVLEMASIGVDDVVVIGYGTVRKDDMTGSVSVIRAEDTNRGAVTNVQQLMLGKVAGLNILPGDGAPGSPAKIRIRGQASLSASRDPLIVIDGIPIARSGFEGMADPLGSLNPNDIESFSILKDASATAIYGSRASNGVIIIQTKKGRSGTAFNLTYNSSYYIKARPKRVNTMQAEEYRSFMSNFYAEGTPSGDLVREKLGDYNTDWQKEVTRSAFGTDHTVSAYGSISDFLPYRASLGYTNEQGTLKTSDFERVTADLSLSPKFFYDKLSVNLNAKGFHGRYHTADGGAVGGAAFYNPTMPVYFRDADGNIDYQRTNGFFNVDAVNPASHLPQNPVGMLYDDIDRSTVQRFTGNVQLDYKFHFLPELRANLNVGLDITKIEQHDGPRPYSFTALKDAERPGLGKYTLNDRINRNQLLDFYLSYAKEINKHRFDVMAGYSWQYLYESNDPIVFVNDTNEMFIDNPASPQENYLVSFFGRANYSFDSRYLFTFTVRGDGTSRFNKDNRWGIFPAAAAAWNLKNERFLYENPTVSTLKLRLGWGQTGQQDISSNWYPYLPRYTIQANSGTNYFLNGKYYSAMQPLAYDRDIKWETTTTYNIGADYGFFNGRLSGSVDAYLRKTKDLISEVNTPLGSNFSNTVFTNIGNMENKGFEFSVSAIPLQTSDWTMTVGFNGTWQQTEITKLTGDGNANFGLPMGGTSTGMGNTIQLHRVGYAPYTYFPYQQVYDNNGNPVQNVVVDRNGNGEIDSGDRYMSDKSPDPDFFYGINFSLQYRNWDFGFNGHGSVGNWVFNDVFAGNSTPIQDLNQPHITNLHRNVYRTGFTNSSLDQQNLSDYFLEDASFFKLDDITLGYTFQDIGQSKLRIRTAFSVQNVFTITNYRGLDPEVTNMDYGNYTVRDNDPGIDRNMWPRSRIYTLRLSVNF